MGKIEYNNELYNIVDIINFEGTYHLIIANGENVNYVNKKGDNYYRPPTNLILNDESSEEDLVYVRKQHILKMLIEYVKTNNKYKNIKDITALFKEYIKTSYIETFIYWPYMSDAEALRELDMVKKDLSNFMDEKLNSKIQIRTEERIVIIECPDDTPTKFLPKKMKKQDEYIEDPSSKRK